MHLRTGHEFLRPYGDDLTDPCQAWERLRANAEAAASNQASVLFRGLFVSHRQSDSYEAVHLANAILACYSINWMDPQSLRGSSHWLVECGSAADAATSARLPAARQRQGANSITEA